MSECLIRQEIERIGRQSRWALTKTFGGKTASDDVAMLNAQIALDAQRVLHYHLEHCPHCNNQPVFFSQDGHKRIKSTAVSVGAEKGA